MYFIALVMPQHLNEKVLQLKQYMQQHYGCKVGLKSPGHITIVPPFWLESNKEEELLADVDAIAASSSPFNVGTNNFSAFKPKTIFIDVIKNDALNKLKEATDHFFEEQNRYDIKTDSRHFHPHITIATRDLYKKDFFEAWNYFEEKVFAEEWAVDSLSVLRHNTKFWDVIHTAPFTG